MINFFKWLFKSSTPKADNAKNKRTEELYFVERAKIKGKTDDKAGLIDSITLAEGASFAPLFFSKKNEIISQNRGIAKTIQTIDVVIEDEKLTAYFENARAKGVKFSVIYRNLNGKFLLYGENNGMEVSKAVGKHLVLSGEEQDTFYTLTTDCARKLVEK